MRHLLTSLLVLAPMLLLQSSSRRNPPAPTGMPEPAALQDGVAVYFSPNGGCTQAITTAIASAKKSLDVQAYYFTSTPIARAIAEAHQRGVTVRVLLDKSQEQSNYTGATYLVNAGVNVWVDHEHEIMHNKVMIIDNNTVITGSFNFTVAAERSNVENVVFIEGKPKIAQAYLKHFEQHLEHAKRYKR